MGALWPPDTGGRLRSFHLIEELSRRHHVTLAITHDPTEDPAVQGARLPAAEVIAVRHSIPKQGSLRFALALARSWLTPHPVDLIKFASPPLAAIVAKRQAARQDDVVVIDFLSASPNVRLDAATPAVYFAHNVEHVIWRRLAEVETRPVRRFLLAHEWRKLRRAEARLVGAAALTVAVSEADRETLGGLAPGARVRAIPTGVDIASFIPGPPAGGAQIVFTGSMDWHPNEDAALWFIDAILPRVRAARPEARFTLVGRRPGERLRAAAAVAGVGVTGTVSDVRPYLRDAAVHVVPLRVGGGTRLKIFEALALGGAVVSTSTGAEGLPLEPGTHYLRADDAPGFAAAVVALLDDPRRRAALGAAGRSLVAEHYGWSQVAAAFERCCETAIEQGHGEAAATPMVGPGGVRRRGARARLRALLPADLRTPLIAVRHPGAGSRHYWGLKLRRALGRDQVAAPRAPAQRVLYVCRGNIIRSPMAEAILRQALLERASPGRVVASAGLYAQRGQQADPRARRLARDFGVSLEAHRARPLTPRMMAQADLVVPMDALIEAELRGRFPWAHDKIGPLFTLGADGRRRAIEIHDPYDGTPEEIRSCYARLAASVRLQAEHLAADAGEGSAHGAAERAGEGG
jgi:protein-tyrosine-phosphatase/glycosyltransferase involved in cell wall biosynthesis